MTLACDNPVLRNMDLRDRLGINGTPTLVAENGTKHAGLLSAAELERWLSAE